jgi:hypothetical protein
MTIITMAMNSSNKNGSDDNNINNVTPKREHRQEKRQSSSSSPSSFSSTIPSFVTFASNYLLQQIACCSSSTNDIATSDEVNSNAFNDTSFITIETTSTSATQLRTTGRG